MKIKLFLVLIFFGFLAAGYAAEQMQQITLNDSSTIIGKVVEMKNGVYVVKSPTLGEIRLKQSNIIAIQAVDSQGSPNSSKNSNIQIRDGSQNRISPARQKYNQKMRNSDNSGQQTPAQDQINSRVRSMTADGDFLNSLMDLSQNQKVMEVMSDPDIMDAISRNDYEYLMNSPKMQELMNSSEIQNLLGDFEK
ncbi:MAG: hypothetical protein ACQETH_01915 [Candidatus Rifleibacteriota bacterium]